MAKLYYNQRANRFEVAAWNPTSRKLEVIDSDADFDALGIRQGFLSEEEESGEDESTDEN